MRSSVRAFALAATAGSLLVPDLAHAGPPGNDSQFKERVERVDNGQPTMTRDQALARLVQAEAQLTTDQAADALLAMVEVYLVLEVTDGAEARGVKELRSWLVKALEALELPDEAAILRQRGSFVDHPLSVMPSTWFKASGAAPSSSTMSSDQALAAVEQGLAKLERGDVDGLAELIDAYFVIEASQGAESEDAKALRSFLVGLLETGGFADEAAGLRQRGSVTPATQEDIEVYAATWLRILEAEQQSGAAVIGGGNIDTSAITGSSTPTTTDTSYDSYDSGEVEPAPEPEPDRPRVDFQKGSVRPSLGLGLGLGSFQPTLGTKGWMWNLGLDVHWTLFRAGVFGMQLGGAGEFGRNRDKRWLTDAYADLRLLFDFKVVYFTPEFGGGYDGIGGGDRSPTTALRWTHAPYYHFGGGLGVRLGEKFGIYARAVRLNRDEPVFKHETRARGGFLLYFDDVALDLAFAFTDYEARSDDYPEARQFMGILGIRI